MASDKLFRELFVLFHEFDLEGFFYDSNRGQVAIDLKSSYDESIGLEGRFRVVCSVNSAPYVIWNGARKELSIVKDLELDIQESSIENDHNIIYCNMYEDQKLKVYDFVSVHISVVSFQVLDRRGKEVTLEYVRNHVAHP